MKTVSFDYTSNLNLLLNSPTEIHKFIFNKWNEFQFGELRSDLGGDSASKTEVLRKQLKFLYPYQFLLGSPFHLPNIQAAIEIIKKVFHNREKTNLLIYADRDADGICSASILYLFLRDKMGFPDSGIKVLVPEVEDKYGVTEEVADRICGFSPDLLITLDNGSSNKESFERIRSKLPQVEIIIIDHHTLPASPEDYPRVNSFINPALLPGDNTLRNMCTSGLIYLFIQAITYSFTQEYDRTVLLRGSEDCYIKNGVICDASDDAKVFYMKGAEIPPEDKNADFEDIWNLTARENFQLGKVSDYLRKNPEALSDAERFYLLQIIRMPKIDLKIKHFLPLAAIGTVADSMLLTDENRILVAGGLELLNNDKSSLEQGLKEIIKILQLFNVKISEQDLAFSVCPMVNAAGRMGHAVLALNTFVSRESLDCAKNAYLLKEENEKRKELSHQSLTILEESIRDSREHRIVIGYHEEIHRGISGLIASKLAEKYEKPALVLVHDGEYLRGSIRSYQNENVLAIIRELSHWFVQYGGHIQAAGFSLEHNKREEFIRHLIEKSNELLGKGIETAGQVPQNPVIPMEDRNLTPGLWKEFLYFAPYGPGNPRPRVLVTPTAPVSFKLMGKNKNHARIVLSGIHYTSIDAVWFGFTKDIHRLEDYTSLKILAEPQVSFFKGIEKQQLRVVQIQHNL